MKRYRLKKELPTFKKGELFHTDEDGNLWRDEGQNGKHWRKEVMAYNHLTIERFPNILTDWFEEFEERDPLSKEAFIEYLRANPEQRLMQAICNFAGQKLDPNIAGIMVRHTGSGPEEDTWHWECDQMMLRKAQKLEQMKKQLKDWAERNDVKSVVVYYDQYGCDDRVRFRKLEDFNTCIEIEDWPKDGLDEGRKYGINYLLDSIKTGKE